MVVSIIMLVSGYNNIILLHNCTLLYYVFSGPLSLCAYVPEIKFNNNNNNNIPSERNPKYVNRTSESLYFEKANSYRSIAVT